VVANQLVAAVGENRRTAHQTCALLLVAIVGEPSDAAVVWRHAADDHNAAVVSRIGEREAEQISVTRWGGKGEESENLSETRQFRHLASAEGRSGSLRGRERCFGLKTRLKFAFAELPVSVRL